METDTKKMLDVTAPDNILISGRLAKGGVVSAHIASIPWAGSGYRMEIYGREGTLVATSDDSPQLGPVQLQGVRNGDALAELDIPEHHKYTPEAMPEGAPYNVGQLYYLFSQAIHLGEKRHPDFDTAVDLHRFIDAIRQASDEGREIKVG